MDVLRGVYHSEDVIPVVYQCEYESLSVQHIENVLWCLPVWGCHPTDDGRTQSVWRRAAHWSLVWTSTTLTLHLPHTTLTLPHITPLLTSHHPLLTSHHPPLTSHHPQLTKYQPPRSFISLYLPHITSRHPCLATYSSIEYTPLSGSED